MDAKDKKLNREKELNDYMLIKDLLEQYKTRDSVLLELRKIIERIEDNIRLLVKSKCSTEGPTYKPTIAGFNSEDYLALVHEKLSNFDAVDDQEFSLERMKELIYWHEFEEFAHGEGIYTNAHKKITEDLSTLFRFMQSARILLNTEMDEVIRLYGDLIDSYQ